MFLRRCLAIMMTFYLDTGVGDVSNAALSVVLRRVVSSTPAQSVLIVGAHGQENLVRHVQQSFAPYVLKQVVTHGSPTFQSGVLKQIRNAMTFSDVEVMKNTLTFVVICHSSCVRDIIQQVRQIDKDLGRGVLIQHFSKWIIIPPASEDRTYWTDTLFDNMLVLYTRREIVVRVETLRITSQGRQFARIPLQTTLGTRFFPNLAHGMNARQLIVLAMEWSILTKQRQTLNGSLDFVGVGREALDVLAGAFNFTFQFVMPEDRIWGKKDKDGNWIGVVGMLQRSEADMCISTFAPHAEWGRVMSYGYFLHYEDVVVLYKSNVDHNRKWLILVSGFSVEVYLVGLLTAVLTTLSLIGLEMIHNSYHDAKKKETGSVVTDALSYIGTMSLRQVCSQLPVFTSSRILLFFWAIFTVIMTSVYTGNLMASLTVSKDIVPFSTLEELAASKDYDIDVILQTSGEGVLQTSKLQVFKKLWKRIEDFRGSRLQENSHASFLYQKNKLFAGGYALIAPSIQAHELMNEQCGLLKMRETVIPLYTSFVFPLNSTLPRIFYSTMASMVDTGLINGWDKKWSLSEKPCDVNNIRQRSVDVSVILSALVACVAGISIGCIVLVLERFYTTQKR